MRGDYSLLLSSSREETIANADEKPRANEE